MAAATVREAIVQAFQSVKAVFEEKDVIEIEAKVTERNPSDPPAYAFITARNWAVGRHRKARIEAARILRQEREATEARRAGETERQAREEFSVLYRRLAVEVTPTRLRQLQIVNLVCLEGMDDWETAARFPGTTPAARWQWKKRGVALLWPLASEALREVLSRRAWRRR